MELTYDEKQKRKARNHTANHLYPNLRKILLDAKKARLKDDFEEEMIQLEYALYGVQRRMSEVYYILDHRKTKDWKCNSI